MNEGDQTRRLSGPMPYNGFFSVWKAVSIIAVLALLGLWARIMRRP